VPVGAATIVAMPAPTVSLIAIVARNGGIGRDNALLVRLPEDLAHFKRVTLGHPIIMGRKTFDSIGRPLPKRRNIVVTRNAQWSHEGVDAVSSLQDAIALVGDEPASIIGGAQVFSESMSLASRMIVTEIAHTFRCDTFFPPIDKAVWQETARERHHSEANGFDYDFVTYERVK
jgi:dihydrofolate reductase